MQALRFTLKPYNSLEKAGRRTIPLPDGPERSCPNCHRTIKEKDLENSLYTCVCGHHFRLGARKRISLLVDEGSFSELFASVESADPLSFPFYGEKLEKARTASGEREAVLTGEASICGERCALFVMDPNFMMGSLGAATGEKITRLFEHAAADRLPVVGFTVSGGARMQEGLLSLMQMAKTSGAVEMLSRAGLVYITVLTDPTTGGVTASFAMEGDIILAEPGATVGFAGARVIEQTTGKALPKGFQTSEFLLEHGFCDAIVPRQRQREVLSFLLGIHSRSKA